MTPTVILYERLKDLLENDGKLVSDSVLLSFLAIKANQRLSFLNESACLFEELPGDIEPLVEEGLLQRINGKYCLTAHAVWDIEKENIVDSGLMIKYLQNKYFLCPEEDCLSLTDKQKVVLLAFIIGRAFSDKTAMDLKLGDNVLRQWEEIIFQAYDILKQHNCISIEKDKLFGKKKNEDPVSDFFRHTDELPRKTWLMYEALGDQKYCLKVIDADWQIDKSKLIKLFHLIFDRVSQLSYSELEEISEECNAITNDRAYLCFEDDNQYISFMSDSVISEAFMDMYGD